MKSITGWWFFIYIMQRDIKRSLSFIFLYIWQQVSRRVSICANSFERSYFASQMQFCGGIQIGLKKTYENGMTTIAGAVINLAVNITMIRYWGLSAASFSTLIANLSVAWLRKMRLRKVVQFKYEKKTWFAAAFYLYFVFTVYICQGNMLFNGCMWRQQPLCSLYSKRNFWYGWWHIGGGRKGEGNVGKIECNYLRI